MKITKVFISALTLSIKISQGVDAATIRGSVKSSEDAVEESYHRDLQDQTLTKQYTNEYLDKSVDMPNTCVLFTAPHSKFFRRGYSNREKARETHTNTLAKRFSETIGGGYIVWNDSAIANSKNKDYKPQQTDPRYWDPNYLPDKQRSWYGWMKFMRQARKNCKAKLSGLHVDLHGMTDATAIRLGEHLIIGTRAMETVKNGGTEANKYHQYDRTKSEKLEAKLKEKLEPTFKELRKKLTLMKYGEKLPLGIGRGKEPQNCGGIKDLPGTDESKKYLQKCEKYLTPGRKGKEKFVGDWQYKSGESWGEGKNTMTRISTEKRLWSTYGEVKQKPFGCAVQVEMSYELRQVLKDNEELSKEMARKIRDAFRETGCRYNDMKTSPTMDVW